MFHSFGFYISDFLPLENIRIAPTDLSVHRGYSIFDFFKMRNGNNPWMDLYLDRLINSCVLAGLQLDFTKKEIKQLVHSVLQKNKVSNANIKVIVSAGPSDNGYNASGPATLLILSSVPGTPAPDLYSSGAQLITQEYRRDIPEIKTTNYLMSAKLISKMKAFGAVDVLYYLENNISECSRCNFFVVRKDQIFTPFDHILRGITRHRVMNESCLASICTEKAISLNDIQSADEVFITSTTKGVMPIVKIDDQLIGSGKVGTITKTLIDEINPF